MSEGSRGALTAVVVSKGLDALLDVCLVHLREALEAVSGDDHAIVVVDNASPMPYDPLRFRVPDAHWLRFDVDRSFARACNAGFAARPAESVLLVNNDVLLAPETVVAMARVLDADPFVGICGTRLLFPDGTIQHAGVVFGADRKGPYHLDRGRPAALVPRGVREHQAVTGACLLARRTVWDELGGLDEDFRFGLEDVDFCLRARQCGWRVACTHETESLHFESMTPGRVDLDVDSRRLFMERWAGRFSLDG